MKYITIPFICLAILFTQACKNSEPTTIDKPCCGSCEGPKKAEASSAELKNDLIKAGIGPCISGEGAPKAGKEGKVLWANSAIWTEAPKFDVEKWLGDEPDMKRKYVLIEFWNTWCPPCRRSLTLLNYLHDKYKDELVVIAVCDETEEAVKACMKKGHKITCYNAINTKGTMKKALGVRGVPHAIIIEPTERTIIWEGYPLLKGYELTEKKIEKILAIGRKEGIIGKEK